MDPKDYFNAKKREIIFLAYFFVIILTGIGMVSFLSFDSLSAEWCKVFSFLIASLVFITVALLLLSIFEDINNKRFRFITYLLNIILIILISVFIFIKGDAIQISKMFLILPIIIASINGLKPGLIFAFLGSGIIIYIHGLCYTCERSLNLNIIFAGIFIFIAWLIGSFIELEKREKTRLEIIANLDYITGLYNLRYFKNFLIEKIDNSAEKEAFAVIAIDIDYYRYYVDMFGLQNGNILVQRVASIIKSFLNRNTLAASFGGSSFIILLPESSVEKIWGFVEGIRQKIEEESFFGEKYLPGEKITASAGIAIYPKDADSASSLIINANEALFKAKAMGSNRVELFTSIFEGLENKLDYSEIQLLNSLKTFVLIINARDKYTYAHSERVMRYALKVADAMEISEDEKKALLYASFFHDIGKIEIDKNILSKPEDLSDEEKAIIKKHPLFGAAILKPIELLKDSVPIILYHHENVDGSGYPDGLTGDKIPLGAKILRVVNSFDAMVTERPYRSKMSVDKAISELKKYAGIYYDPDIVEIFISILDKEKNKDNNKNE